MSRLFGVADALDSDAWYTPAWVFDGLGLTFDLDVAAPSVPIDWIPALQSYTVADDGLSQPWHGTVWCNPPFSGPLPWCERWALHDSGCILLRCDLSTSATYKAFAAASSIFVPSRRLEFVNGQNKQRPRQNGSGIGFSSILLGRGSHVDAALVRLAATYGGATRLLEGTDAS